ncbi:MAG: ATP-binding protein [Clostridiales bacterium]|nr:ATP-binding protein [Clostridiales bacterium]
MKKLSHITPLLPQAGEAAEYKCEACQDTGWLVGPQGASPCACRKERLLAARRKQAGLTEAMLKQTFKAFELKYYQEYLQVEQGISYRALAYKAKNACRKFTRDIIAGREARSLLLEGGVGRGKSHLAAACAGELVNNGIETLFLVVPEFLDEIRAGYQKAGEFSEGELTWRACHVPVLILDDLGAHNFSDWTKNKIFTLINHRLNLSLPCIITTNLDIEEMKEAIGERTVSRIVELCDFYRLESQTDIRLIVHNQR